MKKTFAMIALVTTVLTSCTATPTFAYTEENANPGETVIIGQDVLDASSEVTEPVEETTETPAEEAPEETQSEAPAEENTEAEEPVIDRSEPVDPLTPDGNMTLVDDVTTGTKQFLTLTTRDGNFYYLIIDRDKDGNENVHFLNQVDERDLISLMDEDEAKELEEQLARKAEEEEAAQVALTLPATEPEPEVELAPEPEKIISIGGFKISQKVLVAIVGCLLFIIFGIVAFVKLGKKKKPEANKPDPDADYEEDLRDEMEIEQGEWDDSDYDE